MKELIKIIPIGLYIFVGIISLVMACKCLFSNKFISFHQEAAGIAWDNISKSLQFVILALMRVSGLGFLAMGCLMIVFPIVNYFNPDPFSKYAVPVISFLYCSGLFLTNYYLYRNTKAKTPWKASLLAMFLISLGLVISSL
jgi:hypothetical protein